MMSNKKVDRAKKVLNLLEKKLSTKEPTGLKHWSEGWQFLFCVILSAQSNDDQINRVSPSLFQKFKTLNDFQKSPIDEIKNSIRTIGLY